MTLKKEQDFQDLKIEEFRIEDEGFRIYGKVRNKE